MRRINCERRASRCAHSKGILRDGRQLAVTVISSSRGTVDLQQEIGNVCKYVGLDTGVEFKCVGGGVGGVYFDTETCFEAQKGLDGSFA